MFVHHDLYLFKLIQSFTRVKFTQDMLITHGQHLNYSVFLIFLGDNSILMPGHCLEVFESGMKVRIIRGNFISVK